MTHEEILSLADSAITSLFESDSELFRLGTGGISEQTVTFRLGHYLQLLVRPLTVDCEYNRIERNLKTDTGVALKWMKPDIIVHRRLFKADNALVIEAKKKRIWTSEWHQTESKLKAFTRRPGRYEYCLGLAWRIAEASDPRSHLAVWFCAGQEIKRTALCNFKSDVLSALSTANLLN